MSISLGREENEFGFGFVDFKKPVGHLCRHVQETIKKYKPCLEQKNGGRIGEFIFHCLAEPG